MPTKKFFKRPGVIDWDGLVNAMELDRLYSSAELRELWGGFSTTDDGFGYRTGRLGLKIRRTGRGRGTRYERIR